MALGETTIKVIKGVTIAFIAGTIITTGIYFLSINEAYVAKVNGERITIEEYEKAFTELKQNFKEKRPEFDENTEPGRDMVLSLKKRVIDQLIENKILLQQANLKKIPTNDDEIVELSVKNIINLYCGGSKDEFEKILKRNGQTIDGYKSQLRSKLKDENFKNQQRIQLLYGEVVKDIKISDQEIKDYYERYKDRYKIPEEIRASHILVKDENTALKVLDELKKGKKFEDLASKYSTDPGSKNNGGDLGFFSKGRMVKPFEDAVWSLKDGEITKKPVKTDFGYHIIKRIKTNPPYTKPYEEVKSEIKTINLGPKQQSFYQKWLENIKKDTKIKVKPGYTPEPTPLPTAVVTPKGEPTVEPSKQPNPSETKK